MAEKLQRGFALMSRERVKEIAALGGRKSRRGPNKPKLGSDGQE